MIFLLQNDAYYVLEIVKVLLSPLLKSLLLVRKPKIHEFHLALESNTNVVSSQVTMRNPHIVEKRIHSQKFLYELIEVFRIAFEKSTLRTKRFRKIFKRYVMIGG